MTRFGGWGLAALIAVVTLARVISAQADMVQGAATVGAAKITLASGMAVGNTTATGPVISVLLSDKPADRQAFATDTKTGAGEPLAPGIFEGAWKSQHIGKKLSGFTFTVSGKANIISDEFLVGGKNNTFSLGTSDM